jgi:hypothetical protein
MANSTSPPIPRMREQAVERRDHVFFATDEEMASRLRYFEPIVTNRRVCPISQFCRKISKR